MGTTKRTKDANGTNAARDARTTSTAKLHATALTFAEAVRNFPVAADTLNAAKTNFLYVLVQALDLWAMENDDVVVYESAGQFHTFTAGTLAKFPLKPGERVVFTMRSGDRATVNDVLKACGVRA